MSRRRFSIDNLSVKEAEVSMVVFIVSFFNKRQFLNAILSFWMTTRAFALSDQMSGSQAVSWAEIIS